MAQNEAMSDRKSAKVMVQRSKIAADGDGRAVESIEVELVSTQMLKQILSLNDQENRKEIEEAAKSAGDGVLVRNPATGYLEIIDDDEVR